MLMADYLNIADVTNSGSRYAGTHTHRMGQYTHARTIIRLMMSNTVVNVSSLHTESRHKTHHHNQSTARILKTDYKE